MDILTTVFSIAFLTSAIRLSIPYIAAAVGECYCERAGILNVGIEGQMLNGAFVAVFTAYLTQNPWLGVLAAILASGLIAFIHAFASIKIQMNQVISGIAINLIVAGGTSTVNRIYFKAERPIVPGFDLISIPILSKIPVIGQIIGNHYLLVYIIIILAIILQFVMYRTTLGYKIRAVGENPRAADTAGINVYGIRYGCTIFAGMMGGLAGSYLSLAQINVFTDNMTAGKGWIALVAVVFGKWSPKGAVLGSLVFGAVEVLSVRAQAYNINLPYELLLLLPYLVTILVFAGFVGKSMGPATLSQPYSKEQQS